MIEPEWLDEAPSPAARKNLAELIAINRYLGGHRILLDQLHGVVAPGERFSFFDVGAASGDMAKAAAARYPGLAAINLDRRALHLEKAGGACLVGDAFSLPVRDRSVDFVHCSLFLHHFTAPEAVRILREFWRAARRGVILQDLERHPLPYYFLPATRWVFRWSELVLHDGPISVAAGFRCDELEELAREAGLRDPVVKSHRPAFRLSLTAMRP
jgi:SAM-dependent methyltransferase